MDTIIPALECPHIGFVFHHYPGKGYQVECQDCGITGTQHPIAGVAMANFEKAVSKAKATERREAKKIERDT